MRGRAAEPIARGYAAVGVGLGTVTGRPLRLTLRTILRVVGTLIREEEISDIPVSASIMRMERSRIVSQRIRNGDRELSRGAPILTLYFFRGECFERLERASDLVQLIVDVRRVSCFSFSSFFRLIEITVNLVNRRIHAANVLAQFAGCGRASVGQPMNVSSFTLQIADASRERAILIGAPVMDIKLALQGGGRFLKTVGQSDNVVP